MWFPNEVVALIHQLCDIDTRRILEQALGLQPTWHPLKRLPVQAALERVIQDACTDHGNILQYPHNRTYEYWFITLEISSYKSYQIVFNPEGPARGTQTFFLNNATMVGLALEPSWK